jgi:DNA-binding PadR family transcriptional regulator
MSTDDKHDVVTPMTPAALHVLLALAHGPRHGYAIMAAVEESAGDQLSVGPGTIYGCISRMEEEGFVQEAPPGTEADGRGRPRRWWGLTDEGRDALAAEAERLARMAELVQSTLVAQRSRR